jgi:hypothetical protein
MLSSKLSGGRCRTRWLWPPGARRRCRLQNTMADATKPGSNATQGPRH